MANAKGYAVDKGVIIIKRDLTELDLFVKKFIGVLKKHSDYLIVSGYVSICTGRTRATEDIDMLIPVIGRENFIRLFDDIVKNGFWCYQGDDPDELYSYIENLTSIRFALKNQLFPNIEMVPFNETKKAKAFEFNHPKTIRINNFEFKIPPIEFEILYKELVLKGEKDMEDANHLRAFFSGIIKKQNFDKYRRIITNELK